MTNPDEAAATQAAGKLMIAKALLSGEADPFYALIVQAILAGEPSEALIEAAIQRGIAVIRRLEATKIVQIAVVHGDEASESVLVGLDNAGRTFTRPLFGPDIEKAPWRLLSGATLP